MSVIDPSEPIVVRLKAWSKEMARAAGAIETEDLPGMEVAILGNRELAELLLQAALTLEVYDQFLVPLDTAKVDDKVEQAFARHRRETP